MEITVNQQKIQVKALCNVQEMLLSFADAPAKGLAIAINQSIVPKANWAVHILQPGDQVMIIKATQGG